MQGVLQSRSTFKCLPILPRIEKSAEQDHSLGPGADTPFQGILLIADPGARRRNGIAIFLGLLPFLGKGGVQTPHLKRRPSWPATDRLIDSVIASFPGRPRAVVSGTRSVL